MTDAVNPLGRFDLPFAEQIDFFRRKTNLGTQTWTDIWEAQHDRAFVVAGAMKADLLNEIRQSVDKAIATGTTLETFRKEFRDTTDRLGWPGKAGQGTTGGFNWRTKVIYETNLRTSYAAGREAQLADPGLQKLLPFRRYVHNDSVLNPRPQHLAWNGLTLPHDHPFWQTHSPPNGWGCRCRVTAVAAPRKGDATKPPPGWDDTDADTGAPPGIDKGWGYAPGASVRDELRALVDGKVAKLPEPLGKALAGDVEKLAQAPSAAPVPPAPAANPFSRVVDLFGNGSRVQYFNDAKGVFVESQRYPSGITKWRAGEVVDGRDQWLGDANTQFKTREEAEAAIRGLKISEGLKASNARKYGSIPRGWDGDARKIARQLADAGIDVERFSTSTQSKSKYIYLDNGLKIRLADHDLPSAYDAPDLDFRYGDDVKAFVEQIKQRIAKIEETS